MSEKRAQNFHTDMTIVSTTTYWLQQISFQHNQSEELDRSKYGPVISMEFLQLLLTHHIEVYVTLWGKQKWHHDMSSVSYKMCC